MVINPQTRLMRLRNGDKPTETRLMRLRKVDKPTDQIDEIKES